MARGGYRTARPVRPGAIRPAVPVFASSGVKITDVYDGTARRQGLRPGSEELAGFGQLTFIFQNDGSAMMIDAQSRVRGSWSQNNEDVTIRLSNCVYHGRIQGGQLSGSAHYLEGQQAGWTFAVDLRQE